MVQDYTELRVWKRAMQLAVLVYRMTGELPREERFGLIAQMRRAAVSVPSNIAEGNARSSRREYLQFLHIARGSLAELHTQYLLARKLYQTEQNISLNDPIKQVQAMTQALINALQKNSS